MSEAPVPDGVATGCGIAIGVALFFAVVLAIRVALMWLLWNYIICDLAPVEPCSWFQAFALSFLIGLLHLPAQSKDCKCTE